MRREDLKNKIEQNKKETIKYEKKMLKIPQNTSHNL